MTTINSAQLAFKKYGEFILPNDQLHEINRVVGYDNEQKLLKNFLEILKNFHHRHEFFGRLRCRMTALLIGPPGVGKTLLVKELTRELALPLFLVYADSVVTQYLGKTLENIQTLIHEVEDYAKKGNPIVVFLDELDALGSERGNVNEVGEIKRAVITLLQHLDRITDLDIPVAFIGATNHENLLDSAIWRRFTLHIAFALPDKQQRTEIIKYFCSLLPRQGALEIDIKELASDEISGGFSGSDIERGFQIAVFRTRGKDAITHDLLADSLKLAGGSAPHLEQARLLSEFLLSGPKDKTLHQQNGNGTTSTIPYLRK
jgi:AAA+ superfamily predicted ATPase